MAQTALSIELAQLKDVPKIHQLISYFADRNEMLHRPLSELYENLRDFYVIRQGDDIIACASLHVVWSDLAEIKAVAVREDFQSQGLGKQLIHHCMEAGKEMGLKSVFVLVIKTAYYEQLGFQQVDVMALPRKVWGECLRCPKFPSCNEVAMVYHLTPDGAESLLKDPGGDVPSALLPVWNVAGRSG
ncbi:MAG: Amino-acid acetyltransferase [Nitrospira sp.]|nr:Amino-acid acetyltransferase [Nitrospira sp.]